jgi:hypothetical protein
MKHCEVSLPRSAHIEEFVHLNHYFSQDGSVAKNLEGMRWLWGLLSRVVHAALETGWRYTRLDQ